MNTDDSWEARMAERARQRELRKITAPGSPPPLRSETMRAPRPWLNGWPRIGDGRTVLIGTGGHCVCCGRCRGIITVAFPPDWEPPGPDPEWPFGEQDCPLCNS